MPLVEDLATWKCPYCGFDNGYEAVRCFQCNKKKVKISTFLRIIKLKQKKDTKQKEIELDKKVITLEKSLTEGDTTPVTFVEMPEELKITDKP